jgi:hypothetical protein
VSVDTRNKRASVVGFALAWAVFAPVPDGSIGAVADRVQIAHQYAGIAPSAPVAALNLRLSDTRLLVDDGRAYLTAYDGSTPLTVANGRAYLTAYDGSTPLVPDVGLDTPDADDGASSLTPD